MHSETQSAFYPEIIARFEPETASASTADFERLPHCLCLPQTRSKKARVFLAHCTGPKLAVCETKIMAGHCMSLYFLGRVSHEISLCVKRNENFNPPKMYQ